MMKEKRKNVLFIMTDQQRWDCLGANGNEIIKTPNLDQLAADGVNFENSFTNAIACVPSRACLMSGQFVHKNGVLSTGGDKWLSADTPTLPGTFAENGYEAVGVGKMHFKPWHNLGGFDWRVFTESKYSPGPDEYRLVLKQLGLLDKRIGHHTPGFGKEYKSMPSLELPADLHIDAFIGGRGVETLEELLDKDDGPFFLMVSFCGPHDPYDPPAPYCDMYRKEEMPTGKARESELNILPDHVLKGITDMGIEHLDLTAVPEAKKQEITAHYYGNITLIDDWIGRLVETLKTHGKYEDTIIVFTSDHGEYLGDHNIYYKGYFPCDSDCKIPLIVKPAGGTVDNVRCSALTGNTDVMPTLLDLADLPIPKTCQGKSLVPLICGEKETLHDRIVTYSEAGPAYRVRTEDTAYVYRENPENDQLYDLKTDPAELENLLQTGSSSSNERNTLHRSLTQWFIENSNGERARGPSLELGRDDCRDRPCPCR